MLEPTNYETDYRYIHELIFDLKRKFTNKSINFSDVKDYEACLKIDLESSEWVFR